MKKDSMRRVAITMAIGLVMAIGVFAARGGFEKTLWPEIAAALCDACFVPSALLISLGLLLFVANDGFFDMLTYGVQKTLRLVQSAEKQVAFPKTFYDYKLLKQGKRAGFGFMMIAGGVYLALAVVFLLCSGAV